ncbi:uncharacterized protein LOC134650860 [Cydia amplana]|uniref:uncharacterized protein LOC134650860 n=1 Tax=Cydia amplana TaxID=1869771 RepID=UPI002FE65819
MHIQRTSLRLCLWACLVAMCWADQPAPPAQPAQDPCSSKTTCSDCIREDSCAWCFAAGFNDPRCFDPALGGTAGCDEAYVFIPDNELSVDQAYNKELSRTVLALNLLQQNSDWYPPVQLSSCTWCFAAGFNDPRCFDPALGGTAGCDEAYVFNPDNELSVDQAYNKELSRTRTRVSSGSGSDEESGAFGASSSAGGAMPTPGSGEKLVQIKPQRVNLKLRQNQMHKLTFVYWSAQNNPLGHRQGSSSGVLTENSDNVVDLVREPLTYISGLKITSAVEITDTSSDAIQIVYYSSCLDKTNVIQTNKCDGLRVDDVVEFTAEITLKECPKDASKWKQSFVIHPEAISEGLTVDLEMRCDCPCDHRGHHAYDDSPGVCSGHGISACGACACQPGRFGKHCECAGDGRGSADQDRGCRPTNASYGALCSGGGNCICGVCECYKMSDPNEVISGQFCECDNFSCDRNKGRLCSGPDHGECVCGKCQCRPEYTGDACDCLLDTESCIPPGEVFRKILGPIQRDDGPWRIRKNAEIKELVAEPNIAGETKAHRLRWFGHLIITAVVRKSSIAPGRSERVFKCIVLTAPQYS